MTLEHSQLVPDGVEIEQPIDLTQQVILRDVILDPEPIEQVLLHLQPSCHRPILPADTASEPGDYASIKQDCFTSIDRC